MKWELKKIGDICKTGAGGTPLKRNKEYYLWDGINEETGAEVASARGDVRVD